MFRRAIWYRQREWANLQYGIQVTDASGQAVFDTIYPDCYSRPCGDTDAWHCRLVMTRGFVVAVRAGDESNAKPDATRAGGHASPFAAALLGVVLHAVAFAASS